MKAAKIILLPLVFAIGLLFTIAIPNLVARLTVKKTVSTNIYWEDIESNLFPSVEFCENLLIVARRPERSSESDPTPHRNSRVALYVQSDYKWSRVTESLKIRSESTSKEPRLLSTETGNSRESRIHGYASVPLGIFTLKKGVWRDDITTAFLISDWGRFDGLIGLHSPQVLIKSSIEINPTSNANMRVDTVLRSSLDKSSSWIHPTHTRIWSFGDSNGCMNLYRPERAKRAGQVGAEASAVSDGEVTYPYDVFLSWFSERGLEPGPSGDLVPLIVVPFEYVHQPGTEDELMTDLPPDIFDRVRAIQGRQLGELP